jgi:hypothetical protein
VFDNVIKDAINILQEISSSEEEDSPNHTQNQSYLNSPTQEITMDSARSNNFGANPQNL